MRVRSLSLILFLSILLVSPQEGGALQNNEILDDVLIYAMPYDFDEYSVYTADSYSTAQWNSAIYATLFKRDPNDEYRWIPELALTTPEISSDGLQYTIIIQDDLYFSNGNELSSKDVDFSFRVAVTEAINRNFYGSFQGFLDNSSIQVMSKNTIQITFLVKGSFPYSLLNFPIIDEEIFGDRYQNCLEGVDEDCLWNDPNGDDVVSAGPFMISSIDNDHEIVTLKANPYYYNADEVKTDVLIFEKIADKDSAISALASGLIDILDSQYVPGMDELSNLEGVSEAIVGDPSTQEIAINHLNPYWGTGESIPGNENAPPLERYNDAVLVRKAMSHTVNRQFAVDEILEGLAEAATTAMPSASVGWDSSLVPRNFSIDVARNYMEMAGFDYNLLGTENEDGTFPSTFFDIYVMSPNTCPARNQWNTNYVIELPKIGIGVVEHVSTGWGEIIPRTFGHDGSLPPSHEEGGFDIFFLGYSWALDWNPTGLYDSSGRCDTGDCGNFYNFDVDEEFTNVGTLVNNYLTEVDYDLKLQAVTELQGELYQNIPSIPILYPNSHWGFADDLSGINPLLISVSGQDWSQVSKEGFSYNQKQEGQGDNNQSSGDSVPFNYLLGVLGIVVLSITRKFMRRQFK